MVQLKDSIGEKGQAVVKAFQFLMVQLKASKIK